MKQLLCLDLQSETSSVEALPPDLVREYIGGSGLAARLLYDRLIPGLDPLGPDNPLLFLTGPLVGTSMPSAGRCSVSALSPQTGVWGESNTGGFIGPELRFSGYDGVLILGRSPRPCWVSIVDGAVRFHDASSLWGQDTYQVQESIRQILGDSKTRIACIGRAGENLVKMAGVVNDHGRIAGRTGMGAVMGSKNLKALAFRGSRKIPLADETAFKSAVREMHQELKDDLPIKALRLAGTAGYVDMGAMMGDMPAGYFQVGEWEKAAELSGVKMVEENLNRGVTCYRCPIICGRETRTVKYRVDQVDGPEYETVAAFGSLALVDDLEAVIYAGHLCNLFGLDTISMGSTIAQACELFKRGLLTSDQTGGMDIRYGDAETSHKLIRMTADREGFGDLLAEGSDALAAFAGAPQLSATVRGLEVPMHDPRSFTGMAPVYALSPRGACHLQGDMYGLDAGNGSQEDLDLHPGDRFESSQDKGRTAARSQAWRSINNSLIVCHFMNASAELIRKALNSATGENYRLSDLMLAGKRIFALKRIINHKLGSGREDDQLPAHLLQPLRDGGTLGTVPDLETLLAGAFQEHGWDPETGQPSGQALEEYGLQFTAPDPD